MLFYLTTQLCLRPGVQSPDPPRNYMDLPLRQAAKSDKNIQDQTLYITFHFVARVNESSQFLPTLIISVTFVTLLTGSSCITRQKSGPISGAEMTHHTVMIISLCSKRYI